MRYKRHFAAASSVLANPALRPAAQAVVKIFRDLPSGDGSPFLLSARSLKSRFGPVLRGPILPLPVLTAVFGAGVAWAQTAPPADQQPAQTQQTQTTGTDRTTTGSVVQSVIVKADQNTLTEPESTGSRLGLTPLETPASVDTISNQTLTTRGYDQIEDAVQSLPGVSSGGSPADPSQFVVRGFVGNQVTLLRDEVYVGPANMVTRDVNSFNLQSVDLLQGPGSVLYGQGAVGGTLNVLTKKPTFTPLTIDAYDSYGSFNTYELGLGAGGQLSKKIAFRSDFSYYASDGYVIHSNPKNYNGTGSLLWNAGKHLSFRLALDVLKDDLPSYYGTPFVSAAFGTDPLKGVLLASNGNVLDARMRYNNYNIGDNVLNSSTYEPNLTISWQPTPKLAITDQAYYYHAARNWRNAETYTFIPAGSMDGDGGIAATDEIGRDRFHVSHNQQLPGNSLNAAYNDRLFGKTNKVSVGYEFYNISFIRWSGFPNANFADYVDPLHPAQGLYATNDAGDFPSRAAPTKITDNAVYVEDALNVTSRLIAVGGVHFENFYLDRLNFTSSGAPRPSLDFSGNYHPADYRIGAVYNLTRHLVAYGQFATAKDPPGSNIFLVNATNPPFQLASSKEGEVGIKTVLPRSLGEATLALYDISLNNILTATQTSVTTDNGQQKSKGFELSTTFHPMQLVDVNFNTAYTAAKFGFYSDPNTGLIDTGKIPADVPATTTNLWADVRRIGNVPLELGAGWRFVGGRYADNGDQTKLLNYSTVDVYGEYHFTEKLSFTARGRNLFDKAFAQWADINYPSEIVLGAPRNYMISFNGRF